MANSEAADNPFETIPRPPEEAGQIDEIAGLTVRLLDKRYPPPARVLRGVHPKSHGCVRAFFEVHEDIAEPLQVGLFARPGKRYHAWIRFSNAAVRVAHDLKDGKHGSRGMAVKVMGVKGDVLLEDDGGRNQDFLMINQPAFAFANAEDYLRLTKTIWENDDDATRFFAPLQVEVPGVSDAQKARIARSFKLVQRLQSEPVVNPLEVRYFGAAPFLFGADRVMRFSADPCDGEKPQVFTEVPSEDYLRAALTKTMEQKRDICFDFKVQVRGTGEDLHIEDASTVWDEAETPYVSVARITIPAPQKSIDGPQQVERCEKLAFTPWHCLADHRPLGSINRLRKEVYLASEAHRAADGKGRKRPRR
jgi:hypothetical protein